MIDRAYNNSNSHHTDAGQSAAVGHDHPMGRYAAVMAVTPATVATARRQLSAHIEARLEDQRLEDQRLDAQRLQQRSAALERPRVLHIDADPDSALLLATLLVPETEVTHVYTLAAALRAIGQGDYGLVVLDPELPDGDGAAVFEALKAAGAPTPVLLHTASDTPWRDQASATLMKPWASPRQLWGAATRLVGLRPPALVSAPAAAMIDF